MSTRTPETRCVIHAHAASLSARLQSAPPPGLSRAVEQEEETGPSERRARRCACAQSATQGRHGELQRREQPAPEQPGRSATAAAREAFLHGQSGARAVR